MITGLYAAANGMVAQIARQDSHAHNLANANTVGFRGTRTAISRFADSLAAAAGLGSRTAGAVCARAASLDTTDGPLVSTGNALDLAVSGPACFVVQTPTGVAYTADGRFRLDDQRRLVTQRGDQVLGETGPVTVPQGDVTINERGELLSQGQRFDRLRLAEPVDPEPLGAGLYRASQARPAQSTTVHQGMVEQSNVSTMLEMGRMLSGFRLYEANATALRYQDQSLGTLQKIVE
jgi:flagellar basal-body rod protein FlgG